MDFNALLSQLAQGIQKGVGNAVFPQMADKGGSRGKVGDFLAEKYYNPPMQSPVASDPANKYVPEGIYGSQNVNVNQPGLEVLRRGAPMTQGTLGTSDKGMPQPTPTPTYMPPAGGVTPEQIQAGIMKWSGGKDVPIATLSGELAKAGNELPDPYLPAVLALKESAGKGNNLGANNNWFNVNPGKSYPTPESSIYGTVGDGFQSLIELLREGGLYQGYRDSGNIADLLRKFTPPGGLNPSMEDQVFQYNNLRQNFQ